MTKLDTTIWLYATKDLSSLLKVLHGYNNQNYRLFEVVIIADENREEVTNFVNGLKDDFFFTIRVSNSETAIEDSNTDYIVWSNTEMVVSKVFLEEHIKLREEGFFVWGKQAIFSEPENLNIKDIYDDSCFEINWLRENGFSLRFKESKMVGNVSAWKTDFKMLENINYFESKKELTVKLRGLPRKAKKLRSQLICLHLQSK